MLKVSHALLILAISLEVSEGAVRAAPAPGLQMSLDAPASGTVVQPFTVAGWALDTRATSGTGIDAVHVWAWPSSGQGPIWIGSASVSARPDVAAVFGAQFVNSGFALSVSALSPGDYTVVVYARSGVTGEIRPASVAITVVSGPEMSLDTPAGGAVMRQPFEIAGWAVDRSAPSGTGVDAVHVWAYPASGGSPRWIGADYGRPRADVGAALGAARFTPSGYQISVQDLPAGAYRFVAFARSTVTGTFRNQKVTDATVQSNAQMSLDGPPDGAMVTQPFAISGWALDAGVSSSTGVDAVHVWAYPADGSNPLWVGSSYGIARPDVSAVFGDARFTPSGYRVMSSALPPGRYTLVVAARTTAENQFLSVRSTTVTVEASSTIAGAGDIGQCAFPAGASSTGALLSALAPTIVLTAGDNAYPSGTPDQFASCYDPYWGPFKSITRPSPGNHDYQSTGAGPYFDYFGLNAGPTGIGYYSYDAGRWHVVSLNSEVQATAGSPQETWLRSDLAAHQSACTLVYWHQPRFTSGPHSADTSPSMMADIWQALYEYGVDVVVNGHDHTYERFAPQRPDGSGDPARGIRQFVVGTGGANLTSFVTIKINSEMRVAGTFGVLRLTLGDDGYLWQFVGVDSVVRDSGLGNCVR